MTQPELSFPLPKRIRCLKVSHIRGLRVFAHKEKARRKEAQRQRYSDLILVGGVALFVLLYFGWGIYNATKP